MAMSSGLQALAAATAHRGETCELCGMRAKPRPGFGKLRYAHHCPHGRPCIRGERLAGVHANHSDCPACMHSGPRALEERLKRNA